MRNYIQPGDFLTIQTITDVVSGDLVVIDTLVGVAAHSAATGKALTIATEGVYELPKVETENIPIGSKVRTENGLITVGAKGVVTGVAIETAGIGTKIIRVKLA